MSLGFTFFEFHRRKSKNKKDKTVAAIGPARGKNLSVLLRRNAIEHRVHFLALEFSGTFFAGNPHHAAVLALVRQDLPSKVCELELVTPISNSP